MEKGSVEITPSHVTGMIAVAVSAYFLIMQRDDLFIVAASFYFILACTTDTFKAKIPNLLNACLIIAGIIINTVVLGIDGTFLSLSGLGLGVCLLMLPYIMGGMGAGDVKALGALGALIGPYALLHVFVYIAFWGGGFAFLHLIYKLDVKKIIREGWVSAWSMILTRKAHGVVHSISEARAAGTSRFPYSAAIALGYYSFIYWGPVL